MINSIILCPIKLECTTWNQNLESYLIKNHKHSMGFSFDKWALLWSRITFEVILQQPSNVLCNLITFFKMSRVLVLVCNPSLNNQFCIKGLVVVWDFCFWAVWAAGPVLKKNLGQLWATFEGGVFMFSCFKNIRT